MAQLMDLSWIFPGGWSRFWKVVEHERKRHLAMELMPELERRVLLVGLLDVVAMAMAMQQNDQEI